MTTHSETQWPADVAAIYPELEVDDRCLTEEAFFQVKKTWPVSNVNDISMHVLDKTAWKILNATADDWENLEEIYRTICFETIVDDPEAEANGVYLLKPLPGAPLLQELADRIEGLVDAGLLVARDDEADAPASRGNARYVWQAWFGMAANGRKVWADSKYAAFV